MNTLEDALHYPWGTALPATGGSLEIAPGVRWLRMGLPFALDHINLWLLRDEVDGRRGWSAVDTCVDRPQSRAQWEQVIAGEMGGLPIVRLLATHMHPDHLGLAHWLCERFDARLWISMSDYLMARLAVSRQDSFGGQATADFFARHGVLDAQVLATVVERKDYYARMVPAVPAHYRRLQDGQRLTIGERPWRCISGYGHSPEHMALFCDDASLPQPVLISGDMVLPRISTNISVYETEPEGNPLQLFLDSLKKFLTLPEQTLVLPSHGRPFTGLHERVRQLQVHHQDRLDEVLRACREKPQCAAEIVGVMFKRTLDVHQTTFALGESMAHLNLLWHQGQLRREVDASGVLRFSAA
jgi:glyoxylase-like metal-dependent hydrolase (beta-lactamase superfamily II)